MEGKAGSVHVKAKSEFIVITTINSDSGYQCTDSGCCNRISINSSTMPWQMAPTRTTILTYVTGNGKGGPYVSNKPFRGQPKTMICWDLLRIHIEVA